jgi:hypothetical protein
MIEDWRIKNLDLGRQTMKRFLLVLAKRPVQQAQGKLVTGDRPALAVKLIDDFRGKRKG